ncbi:MAG: hypothetical protein IT370_21010 [Deltaproteobacteria bacterium]|nr:hypothetical protein [Deltaproteobacteria bacterium]
MLTAHTPVYLGEGQPVAARSCWASLWPRPEYGGTGAPAASSGVGRTDVFGVFPRTPAYLALPVAPSPTTPALATTPPPLPPLPATRARG